MMSHAEKEIVEVVPLLHVGLLEMEWKAWQAIPDWFYHRGRKRSRMAPFFSRDGLWSGWVTKLRKSVL